MNHTLPIDPARLEFRNVSVKYGSRHAIEDVSIQVPHGARVAVVGPNGAGKSTLFKALVSLLPLDTGNIYIHGRPLGHHLDCVAYVPQREEVDWHFPVTVRDVVMMGRYGRLGLLKQPGQKDRTAVDRALQQMEIDHLSNRSIQDLSGGQQQRVFLARALAQQPHILVMDEPFNGVDTITRDATLRLLKDLTTRDVTMMVSTHDFLLAREHFDLVLLINRKVIAFGTPVEVFTTEHVSLAFQSQMMLIDGALVVDQCCGDEEHTHIHGGEE